MIIFIIFNKRVDYNDMTRALANVLFF